MSLQVWLPLTKDLRQQGVSEVIITNNGATFDSTGGKLGGCYFFDGVDDRISCSSYTWTYPMSISAWFKPTDVTNTNTQYWLSYNTASGGTAGHAIAIGLYGAKLSIWYGGKVRSLSTVITNNVWYHIAVTIDANKKVITYLNGIQIDTVTFTSDNPGSVWLTLGARSNSSTGGAGGASYFYKGYMNDVRLYDHCLSSIEAKELAKGLVLHYPLNRKGWGQENLIKEANALNLNRPFTNSDYSSRGAYVTCPANTNTVVLAQTGSFNCYRWFNNDSISLLSITSEELVTPGQPWVFSLDIKSEVQGTFTLWMNIRTTNSDVASPNLIGNASVSTNLPSDWTRYWVSITPRTEDSARIKLLIGISGTATTSGTIYFKNLKFEKGTIMTPWCPSKTETLATAISLNSTTEYDCSGFYNNGTRTGTFSWTSDTPKYQVSTNITPNSNIQFTPMLTGAYSWTIAAWIKPAVANNDGKAWFSIEQNTYWQVTCYSNQLGIRDNSIGGTGTRKNYSFGTIAANTWVHLVATYDNGTLKLYNNGVLKNTNTVGGTYLNAMNNGRWGSAVQDGYYWNGQISDARIYATALSADDVKSLYQNNAYIDSNDTIHGKIRD